jgi:poly-gamma-glutamate synthesis protein (capsule biosynthesis protein)
LASTNNDARRSVRITGVGDIMLDQRLRPPRIFYHFQDLSVSPGAPVAPVGIPFVNTEASLRWLESLGRNTSDVVASAHAFTSIPNPSPPNGEMDIPFAGIRDFLTGSDVVIANLECPLTARGRRFTNDACYAASPHYAHALKRAGIDVVSFANNHCFDFGDVGFDDTLAALRDADVGVVGAGATLEQARAPLVITRCAYRIAFIAYSMIGSAHIFATSDESGIAPFNPLVVAEDVAGAKRQADFAVVSVHWGRENEAAPSYRIVELAHDCIDAGADVVFGHHSHVPGSIEIYKGRPIFYSLGNFIFGHTHREWGVNIAASVSIESGAVKGVRITPLAGHFGPSVATGAAAEHCLRRLEAVSRGFGTRFVWDNESAAIDWS